MTIFQSFILHRFFNPESTIGNFGHSNEAEYGEIIQDA